LTWTVVLRLAVVVTGFAGLVVLGGGSEFDAVWLRLRYAVTPRRRRSPGGQGLFDGVADRDLMTEAGDNLGQAQ
jgi:hypothetical protein